MRIHPFILVFGLVMAACSPSPRDSSMASPSLSAIDSLMWERPDSALVLINEFVSSQEANNMDEFNWHYCQLLISELLYKNHDKQDNRSDLQRAVNYFDTNDDAFLSARAHYMNGVGYYEQDSMVEACAEYLKTVEIIETHFPNVETRHTTSFLPKHLPRFMSLTYSRLGELLSKQFMQEPAIVCLKKSLVFDNIEPGTPNNHSTLLLFVGTQYYKLGQCDSAAYYFDEALHQLSDTNNMVFRDLVSIKALLDYDVRHHVEAPINDLKRMIAQAEDYRERLGRYTSLGVIYCVEGQYDSALFYLTPVFEKSDNTVRKRAVSSYLRTIYQTLGDSLKADQYAVFIADHQRSEGESNAQVSKLNELYQQHQQWEQDRAKAMEHRRSLRRNRLILTAIFVFLLISTVVIVTIRRKSKTQLSAINDVLKAKEQDALLATVNAIYQDKTGNKAKRIVDAFNKVHPDAVSKLKAAYPDLTDTELDICVLSCFAFRLKEIATILDLRENTVAKYRSSIKKKTQVSDVDSLIDQVL